MSDEETRAQEILAPFKKRINQTPALISLLYDADMLPEQIVTVRGAISVAAVVTAYDAGVTDRIEALEMKLATALALIETLESEQARADALQAQYDALRRDLNDMRDLMRGAAKNMLKALDENEGVLL